MVSRLNGHSKESERSFYIEIKRNERINKDVSGDLGRCSFRPSFRIEVRTRERSGIKEKRDVSNKWNDL